MPLFVPVVIEKAVVQLQEFDVVVLGRCLAPSSIHCGNDGQLSQFFAHPGNEREIRCDDIDAGFNLAATYRHA